MKKNFPYFIIPYIIIVALLLIATWYDYPISAFVYDPQNYLGIVFERFVLFPITLSIPCSFYAQYRCKKTVYAVLAYFISCFYVCFDVAHFWIDSKLYIVPIVCVSVLCSFLLWKLLKRIPDQVWVQYARYLRYILYVFLSSMIVLVIIKTLWGRVRYRDMLDITQFTPWYYPQGFTGNYSFPSGHTVAFSVILCLLDAYRIKHTHPPFWWQYGLVFFAIGMMMVSRILMGAHYLSDVTMGFCITYTMFIVIRRRMYREDFI